MTVSIDFGFAKITFHHLRDAVFNTLFVRLSDIGLSGVDKIVLGSYFFRETSVFLDPEGQKIGLSSEIIGDFEVRHVDVSIN